jgi:hypothetical protein
VDGVINSAYEPHTNRGQYDHRRHKEGQSRAKMPLMDRHGVAKIADAVHYKKQNAGTGEKEEMPAVMKYHPISSLRRAHVLAGTKSSPPASHYGPLTGQCQHYYYLAPIMSGTTKA